MLIAFPCSNGLRSRFSKVERAIPHSNCSHAVMLSLAFSYLQHPRYISMLLSGNRYAE